MSVRSRLPGLRTAYLRHKTRDTLRAYLRAKAILGQFDRRMFDYYGVPHVYRASIKRAVVRGYAAGLVPTATTNGTHSPTSLHSSGRGLDLGLVPREIGTAKGARRMVRHQAAEHRLFHDGKLDHVIELIGPANTLIVLRGRETDLVEGSPLEQQHDNHVHVGVDR